MKIESLEDSQSEVLKWQTWSSVFVIIDGVDRVIYVELMKKEKEKACKALFDVHLALKSVCEEFGKVIKVLNEGGTIPPVVLPIPVIDDWGEDTNTADGLIEALRGIVQVIMAALVDVSDPTEALKMVITALDGLQKALNEFDSSLKGEEVILLSSSIL
jgi:hypothetical protein